MKTQLCFIAILFVHCVSAFAGVICGRVVDPENEPLSFASVAMLDSDSIARGSAVADVEGFFKFVGDTGSVRFAKISYLGFRTALVPVAEADMGVVRLLPDAEILSEVIVRGSRPRVSMRGSSMITRIEGSVLEKAGDAGKLLARIPNVKITQEAVEVFGSGKAIVFVDGRELRDLSELERITSDRIKEIEVNNNPGSRYPGNVKAVVRIIMKTDRTDGWGLDGRFGSGYCRGWNHSELLNLNYGAGKFDIGGNIAWKAGRSRDDKTITQTTFDKSGSLDQYSDAQSSTLSQYLSSAVTFSYRPADNTSLGLRYGFKRVPNESECLGMQTDVSFGGNPYEHSLSATSADNGSSQHNANMYFTGKFQRLEVDFNADILFSDSRLSSVAEENVLPTGAAQSQNVRANSVTATRNRLYAAKLQVSYPLGNGLLSSGAEYSNTFRSDIYDDDYTADGKGRMNITDNISSIFIDYGRLQGRVQWQAGLRFETFHSNYNRNGIKLASESRTNNSFFPFASVLVPVGDVKLNLTYRASTERPTYWQLRNNIIYVNRYTYEKGNATLRPATTHKASLSAVFRQFDFTAGISYIKNGFERTFIPYDDNPAVGILTYNQSKPFCRMNLALTISPVIGMWSPQWGIQIAHDRFTAKGPVADIRMYNPVATLSWRNSVRLPGGFVIGLDMGYASGGDMENTSYGSMWRMDASVYKGFLNDCMSILLNVDDIFCGAGINATLVAPCRILKTEFRGKRSIGLTLRYKFNTSRSLYGGKGAGNDQKLRF